jgi:hypothetical protein
LILISSPLCCASLIHSRRPGRIGGVSRIGWGLHKCVAGLGGAGVGGGVGACRLRHFLLEVIGGVVAHDLLHLLGGGVAGGRPS